MLRRAIKNSLKIGFSTPYAEKVEKG